MKTTFFILFALIAAILVGNFLKINDWVARQSVPLATYITLYPFPFHIESAYSDGEFQGIEIGRSMAEVIGALTSDERCQVMIDGRLVEMANVDLAGYGDGELIMRCRSGGVAWNQIFLIQEKVVRQVRISGGLWL